MLKAFFVFELFTFLYWFFGYLEKRLDKKAMVQLIKDNHNTHIAQLDPVFCHFSTIGFFL